MLDRDAARKYWDAILRNHLVPNPAQSSSDKIWKHEHENDFFTPENLVVTLKTKAKRYTFGGFFSASVSLAQDRIRVVFIPPHIRGPQAFDIDWTKIEGLELRFAPKRQTDD